MEESIEKFDEICIEIKRLGVPLKPAQCVSGRKINFF